MKFSKLMITILSLIALSNAMAMPHDRPLLEYYSDKNVNIGLVYSEGVPSSSNPNYHRKLQEVYICKDGKKIADFFNFRSIVENDGVSIIAKEKTNRSINIERKDEGLLILSSTLTALKIEESSDSFLLSLTESGIGGFQLDWSNPCAPRKTDE